MLSTKEGSKVGRDSLPVRGSCFGFEVHSDIAFGALRGGTGDPVRIFTASRPHKRVGKLVHEWRSGSFCAQVLENSTGYVFVVEGVGSIAIDPVERTISAYGLDDPSLREELLCGVPLALCFLRRGDIPLHAAAVEVDDGAVVLAGPGTYGKSTLAAAFAAEGHRVLAEDLVCLRPGQVPDVLPGPAAIRLRSDVVGRVAIAAHGNGGSSAERTRVTFAAETRGDSTPVPVRAILVLRRGDSTPALTPLPLAKALPDLWALSLRLTREDDAHCFRGLVECARGVPIFDLHRRVRFEDLADTVDCVVDAVS